MDDVVLPDHQPNANPLSYFVETQNDGALISWAHAVNSKALLKRALSEKQMMLEADIILSDSANGTVPIMAHPPMTHSDLTFDEWLMGVIPARRGIKLDFKSIESVPPVLERLRVLEQQLRFPVMLNADVLPGFDSPTLPLDAEHFIRLCKLMFPRATLSLGWTTAFRPEQRVGYTWSMVLQMDALLRRLAVDAPLTFPVRAVLAVKGIGPLRWLVDVRSATLTIWSSLGDAVTENDILLLRSQFPHHQVLYDLPAPLRDSLLDHKDLPQAKLSEENLRPFAKDFQPDIWERMEEDDGRVRLGTQSVVLYLPQAAIISRIQHRADGEQCMLLTGVVHFVKNLEAAPTPTDVGLEILIRATPDRPGLAAIRAYLSSTGHMELENLAMPHSKKELGLVHPQECFRFSLVDLGAEKDVYFEVASGRCDGVFKETSEDNPIYQTAIYAQFPYSEPNQMFYIVLRPAGSSQSSYVVVDRLHVDNQIEKRP